MRRVFADTFYFLALLNADDDAHARAVGFTAVYSGELITTAWVLTELADALCSPINRPEFIATLADLRASSQVRIIPPDVAIFEKGIQLFSARLDKEWSLTDCISFEVMKREGIAEALTGDHHFEQAGFQALLK